MAAIAQPTQSTALSLADIQSPLITPALRARVKANEMFFLGDKRVSATARKWKKTDLDREIQLDGHDQPTRRAGVVLISRDAQVVLGHTTSSNLRRFSDGHYEFVIKTQEFTTPAGVIDQEDLVLGADEKPDAEATIANTVARELWEELGPEGAKAVLKNSTLGNRVLHEAYSLQVLNVDMDAVELVKLLNRSVENVTLQCIQYGWSTKDNVELDRFQAFDKTAFGAKEKVDFERHPLVRDVAGQENANLVKYYDPAICAAVEAS